MSSDFRELMRAYVDSVKQDLPEEVANFAGSDEDILARLEDNLDNDRIMDAIIGIVVDAIEETKKNFIEEYEEAMGYSS